MSKSSTNAGALCQLTAMESNSGGNDSTHTKNLIHCSCNTSEVIIFFDLHLGVNDMQGIGCANTKSKATILKVHYVTFNVHVISYLFW